MFKSTTSFVMKPPHNTRRNSLDQQSFLINNATQTPIVFTRPKNKAKSKKTLLRRVSLCNVKPIMQRRDSSCCNRRHSAAVNQTYSINQRETVFTRNSCIPELLVFTPGPGAGKYCPIDSFQNIHPAFAGTKSDRSGPEAKPKTIDNCYLPIQEKVPGYYASTPDLNHSPSNQRKTLFTNPTIIPDLRIFNDSPGVGKYSLPDDSLNKNMTIPKAVRTASLMISTLDPKLPGDHYLPKKEKMPGYYAIGITKPISVKKTPGPGDFIPEKSLDYLRKSEAFTFSQAKRF